MDWVQKRECSFQRLFLFEGWNNNFGVPSCAHTACQRNVSSEEILFFCFPFSFFFFFSFRFFWQINKLCSWCCEQSIRCQILSSFDFDSFLVLKWINYPREWLAKRSEFLREKKKKKMNTSAIKCRITSKSTCSADFVNYRGYSYSSSNYLTGPGVIDTYPPVPYSLTSSPVLRKRSTSFLSNWQLVNLSRNQNSQLKTANHHKFLNDE